MFIAKNHFVDHFCTLGSPDEIGAFFLFPVLRVVDEESVLCQSKTFIFGSQSVLTPLPSLNLLICKEGVQIMHIHT